jgi:hypothetical protein
MTVWDWAKGAVVVGLFVGALVAAVMILGGAR